MEEGEGGKKKRWKRKGQEERNDRRTMRKGEERGSVEIRWLL